MRVLGGLLDRSGIPGADALDRYQLPSGVFDQPTRVLLTDLRGGRSARRAAAEDRSRGVLSACRAEALVTEPLGLSCGAARGRAGRRDAAEIRQKDPGVMAHRTGRITEAE
ncbi:hypothetical protein SVIO_006520 [Streptomyces violaceusniger]|uniref:Uncharacterized protein n=1 Tax=Streptomyces violaceusniger TaxID=68280 RepID=A0A4D4KW06_STRVO|nr:hypothetical protein SVIO_006520 [Streptomyces violaceusniger]